MVEAPGAALPTDATVAWEGTNDCVKRMGAEIRLFMSTWKNPKPSTAVASIDFVSEMTPRTRSAWRSPPGASAAIATRPAGEGTGSRRTLDGADLRAESGLRRHRSSGRHAHGDGPLSQAPLDSGDSALRPRIGTLIGQLDADSFAVREKASTELELLGLEASAVSARPSTEPAHSRSPASRRANHGKTQETSTDAGSARSEEALIVLEVIANDKPRHLLGQVSRGGRGTGWLPGAGFVEEVGGRAEVNAVFRS